MSLSASFWKLDVAFIFIFLLKWPFCAPQKPQAARSGFCRVQKSFPGAKEAEAWVTGLLWPFLNFLSPWDVKWPLHR